MIQWWLRNLGVPSSNLGLDLPSQIIIAVARPDPGGAGQVLREGAARAPAPHADVSPLERQGQLSLRPEEEETETRQERRSR